MFGPEVSIVLQRLMRVILDKSSSADAVLEESEDSLPDASFGEIRTLAKKQIELFEHWSRRLIDELLKTDYGSDYINATKQNGEYLVKSEIRNGIHNRKKSDPGRFARDIDAILLEDVEYFLTKEELYKMYFKVVFEPFYSGRDEIRHVMDRLVPIRNKLYHDNHISIREAEQVLCYTNDFIGVLKEYYKRQGKEREFNVPVLLSISDSQGNRVFRKQPSYMWEVQNVGTDQLSAYRRHEHLEAISTTHRSGERYEVELEVDGSFTPDSYQVEWMLALDYTTVLRGTGTHIVIDFTDEMVSYEPVLFVKLKTNRSWHRFAHIGCDDQAEIHLSKVLPPIEDAY